jgi:hypothetical protein
MTIEPWHKLPNETGKAYAAFVAYLEMGQARSLRKVGEKAGKSQGYERVLARWSSLNDWVNRAAAYDEHRLDDQITKRERALERARQRIIDEVPRAVEELITMATTKDADVSRLSAIRELLDRAGLARVQRIEHTGKGGKPIETEDTTPTSSPIDELARRLASISARG